MSDKVIIPERVKPEFLNYIERVYNVKFCIEFPRMPFDFQSGVYTSFLRSKDIYVKVLEDDYPSLKTNYMGRIKFNSEGKSTSNWVEDYNIALIAALNEGFKLLEEQLQK